MKIKNLRKWFLLKWHKFWIIKHNFMMEQMENNCDCGVSLLKQISSDYTYADRRYKHHMDRYNELQN